MSAKTWFITGSSRGFGREWALAALERGDQVAATARDIGSVDDLVAKYGDAVLPVALDVTERDAVFASVAAAHEHFGRLDVIVNNAGYGQFGMVEELTEDEARAQTGDQLLRRAVGHPGRAAVPPRAAGWALPPGVVDRRHLRVPERRHLPRVQVGVGGAEPGARAGGRRLRHQGHPHRAGWLRDRLERQFGRARDAAARSTTRSAHRRRTGPAGAALRAIRRRPGRPCSPSWTPRTLRCASFSGRHR